MWSHVFSAKPNFLIFTNLFNHEYKMRKFTILFTLIFVASLSFYAEIAAEQATGTSAMVVTAHPLASEMGLEILKSGGNAVDAAVASGLLISAVEPHASGLGGGGAMLIYLQDQDSLTYINYYACAPEKIAVEFNPRKESSSARAVLVPGTVAGLHYALSHYGTISWKDLLLQVIDKIKGGFEVNANFYKILLDSYEKLLLYPGTRSIYLVNNLPPEPGQVLKNEKLISTLKKLATDGPDIFYRGEIADSIEAAMIRHGGGVRKSDLEKYQIRELAPLRGSYRGYEIFSAPPPQSGSTVIEILNILELKNLGQMGDFSSSAETFHFMAEAMKRAYADRIEFLGDPEFDAVQDNILISKEFARTRFETINMEKAEPLRPKDTSAGDITKFLERAAPEIKDREGSTTQISIVDSKGNSVSLTQTLNRFWGSGICVCGFLLNNGMTTFFATDTVNQALPGKQPLTTIAPSMLFKNDTLAIVIGSPGAGRIISTMVEVICNLIDFDKEPQEANAAPRFCSRKWSDILPVESRFNEQLLTRLKIMGHPIRTFGNMNLYFGGVQLIVIDSETGSLIGSSDPRRSGVARGY